MSGSPMITEQAADSAADISALAREIEELRRSLRVTDDVLEKLAAKLFIERQGQFLLEEMTPGQIILAVLKAKDEPMTLLELRGEIERQGLDHVFGHKYNYLYILIRRLERNERIVWDDDARVRFVK